MTKQEFDWSKAHPWTRAAWEFGKVNQGWFEVRPATEEHKAWEAYFQGLGWAPISFQFLGKDRNARWTAPCQWPEWLTIDPALLAPKPRPRLTVVD